MKVGDLVKMKRGYSSVGVVLSIQQARRFRERAVQWVRVLWPDHGQGLEKKREESTKANTGEN